MLEDTNDTSSPENEYEQSPNEQKSAQIETAIPSETGVTAPPSRDILYEDHGSIPIKLNVFDLLYGVLLKPVDTFRLIADTKPWIAGTIVYVLISWAVAIAGVPAQLTQLKELDKLGGMPGFDLSSILPYIALIFVPILSLLGLFIMGGIYHLLAKLLKGQGEYSGIVASLGFASFPNVLVIPFYLLNLVGGPIFRTVSLVVTLSAGFVFGLWVIVLNTLAIRENYKFSTARAIATILIPIIVVSVLVVIFIGIIIAMAVSISNQS